MLALLCADARPPLFVWISLSGWRGPIEYNCRQAIAWMFNLFILGLALFNSLIYALKFGETSTFMMAV